MVYPAASTHWYTTFWQLALAIDFANCYSLLVLSYRKQFLLKSKISTVFEEFTS
jgi:hypothetical protein